MGHVANRIPIFQRLTYVSIMVSQLSFLSENLLNRVFYAEAFSLCRHFDAPHLSTRL